MQLPGKRTAVVEGLAVGVSLKQAENRLQF